MGVIGVMGLMGLMGLIRSFGAYRAYMSYGAYTAGFMALPSFSLLALQLWVFFMPCGIALGLLFDAFL